MFVNKYKYTVIDLPVANNNTFYVIKNEIGWVQGRDEGWTIFWVCDVEGVEDEKLNPFVAILLVSLTQQKAGVVVEMPEHGSNEEKVWGSDDHNHKCRNTVNFLKNTILF